MLTNEADFDALMQRIDARQRVVTRRAMWLTLVPFAIGLAITWYSARQARFAHDASLQADSARVVAADRRRLADSLLQALTAARDSLTRSRESLEAARSGINLFHAGRYDEAVRAYDAVLKNDPSNAYIHNLRGYALFKSGRLDQAVSAMQQSIAADSKYGYGYFDLARVYCAQGKVDEALAAARQALKLRPDLRPVMLANDQEFVRLCRPILARLPEP